MSYSTEETETFDLLRRTAEQQRQEIERLREELEETNRGVMALYAELDERDRKKDEFLATLAHELRNPLSAIRSALSALGELDASAGERAQRLRAIAERQIGHLARLVDDLLDVSRITQGKIELRRCRLDLVELVRRAVEVARPLLDERRHTLILDLADEPLAVDADPTRLEQILDNLLTNAAKYTPEGGRIELSARRRGDEVVLAVTDSGIGIPPHMQERIFHLFAQVDSSLARTSGGLGIGLTLVRKLVEMHGGSISAASEGWGRGSRFTVRLPGAGAPAGRPAGEERAPVPAAGGRPPVLLVEDNQDAREALALLLEQRGHRVGTAADGPAGVAMATGGEWQVALVDIGLPGIDGFEVARRIRAAPGGRRLRLYALSGYGQPEDRRRSRAAGFDRHLIKPVQPAELFRLLDETAPISAPPPPGSAPA